MVNYPRVPGHEISGIVESLGEGINDLSIGSAVTVIPYTACGRCRSCKNGRTNACRENQTLGVQRDGAMAEYLVVPRNKILVTEGLDGLSLAMVEPLTVGFHAVDRAEVKCNDKVVVFGCGMIGLGAIAGAAKRGAQVLAVDLSDRKLNTAKSLGAELGLLPSEPNFLEKISTWSHGDMADVVIEAVGQPSTYRSALEVAGFSSRVCCIGYANEDVPLPTKLIVQKELDLRGSRNAQMKNFEEVIQYLKSGAVPIDLLISKKVNLEDSPEALEQWSKDPSSITKLMVEFP